MSVGSQSYISYFTPGQMSHETLEFIFVKRHKLIDRLVERVAKSALTEAKQHTLLLGPRGIGKSHLVALVYHRVKARADLQGKVALAWLAEEEWGVANLTDFFLVILRALAKEYPESGLDAEIAALKRLPIREVGDAAGQKIRDFVGERTLLLLVENLEEIFRGLGHDGQWALRSYLSEKPFCTILATTPTLFTGVQKQNEAFYGFFQQTFLDELSPEEATELLEKLAERRGDPDLAAFLKTPTALDRVQAVNDLAGGHPRIYLLFAHLLTSEKLDELVTPFLELLDELTPYYQSRMALISPQQRKLAEYLCDRRGAVQVREIAEDNLLDQRAVAAQLGQLERMGYVRKTAVGRESYYELREPLLRMVIEIKRTHNDEPIRLIVDFIRRWYSRSERLARLELASGKDLLTQKYFERALDLNLAMLDCPELNRAEVLSPEYEKCRESGDFSRAAELAAEIIERKGRAVTAIDWFKYAECNEEMERFDDALSSYDRALQTRHNNCVSYGNIDVSTLIYANKGRLLNKIGRFEEAINSADRAIERLVYARSDGNVLLDGMSRDLLSLMYLLKELAFLNLGRFRDVLKVFRKSVSSGLTKADLWFIQSGIMITTGFRKQSFYAIDQWLRLATDSQNTIAEIAELCELLVELNRDHKDDFRVCISLFEKYNLVHLLQMGLILAIPMLYRTNVSQERAEKWLESWLVAAEGKSKWEVTLRLLDAAVAWGRERNPRVFLALPVEERRILEGLLPKEVEGAGDRMMESVILAEK